MHRLFALFLALALSPFAFTQSALAGSGKSLDVMTQNQYLGADLNPVIGAPDFPSFIQAAEEALLQAAANNFPERAQALAEEIADRLPDAVGLQEVFDFTFDLDGPGPIPPMNGPPPFVDHLAATLNALDALGETYVPVAVVKNLDISVPGITIPGLGTVTVGVTDRDVILVREDLAGSAQVVPFPLACPRFESLDGCNYQAVAEAPLPPPLPPIKIQRGFIGVDIVVNGMLHRIVETHLEVREPDGTASTRVIQALQAAELIQTLALFPNPLGANIVIVGDINSGPEDTIIPNPGPLFIPPFDQFIVPPYLQISSSGYTDAWTLRPGAQNGRGYVQGLTCCQLEDLSNQQSDFYERIDVIFTTAVPNKVKKARVLGDRVSDKTPEGNLWPSDHGSVAAELQFD